MKHENNGEIKLGSERANQLGFTKDKFGGYLWGKGKDVYISFITSKFEGKGNLRKLFDNISKAGFNIKVPTPFPRMKAICIKLGFEERLEGSVEILYCPHKGA